MCTPLRSATRKARRFNPKTGELWEVEHGPAGGDELNVIRSGRDYGWPVISYGRQYATGKVVESGSAAKRGMEQPLYYWFPDVALSGLMFYTGDRFAEWKGNLFVGSLRNRALIRLVLDGERVVGEEQLLTDRNQRIRDVQQGPDGAIYLLTGDGALLRIVPKRMSANIRGGEWLTLRIEGVAKRAWCCWPGIGLLPVSTLTSLAADSAAVRSRKTPERWPKSS